MAQRRIDCVWVVLVREALHLQNAQRVVPPAKPRGHAVEVDEGYRPDVELGIRQELAREDHGLFGSDRYEALGGESKEGERRIAWCRRRPARAHVARWPAVEGRQGARVGKRERILDLRERARLVGVLQHLHKRIADRA